MVCDHDEITGLIRLVHTTRSIGQNNRINPKASQQSYGKNNLVGVMTFVGVIATLHNGYFNIADFSKNQATFMAFYSGLFEMRDIVVSKSDFILNLIDEGTEP